MSITKLDPTLWNGNELSRMIQRLPAGEYRLLSKDVLDEFLCELRRILDKLPDDKNHNLMFDHIRSLIARAVETSGIGELEDK